jgi:hypothetical protein
MNRAVLAKREFAKATKISNNPKHLDHVRFNLPEPSTSMSCPRCEFALNATDRCPRLLQCGHFFCTECLTQITGFQSEVFGYGNVPVSNVLRLGLYVATILVWRDWCTFHLGSLPWYSLAHQ